LHLAQAYERVEAVDSSGPSIEQARRNARRNGLDNIQFIESDVFDFLQQAAARERHFDMVVLDPPAFAKSRKHLPAAARGYKEINLKALRLLKRDGILITCSCSKGSRSKGCSGRLAHADGAACGRRGGSARDSDYHHRWIRQRRPSLDGSGFGGHPKNELGPALSSRQSLCSASA
jgi:23S rRNA (cytosine1962-C5)-methyltransferase